MRTRTKIINIFLVTTLIYAVVHFTVNTVAGKKIDEVLASKQIKNIESALGGRLTYKDSGVDAKFSPIINNIEIDIKDVAGEGSNVSIESAEIKELTGLNYNVYLKNIQFNISEDVGFTGGDKDEVMRDIARRGINISLINECDNNRCDSETSIEMPGISTFKINLGSSNVKSIVAAMQKIDLDMLQTPKFQRKIEREILEAKEHAAKAINDFINIYQALQKDSDILNDADVMAELKERSEDVRANTLFRVLNKDFLAINSAEAPQKELVDVMILIDELAKADLLMKLEFSMPKDSSRNLNALAGKFGVGGETSSISNILTDRFKGLGVSLEKKKDRVIAGLSFAGYETNYDLDISASSPSVIEMAKIADKDSYEKAISRAKVALAIDANTTGLGLTKEEITKIIDLGDIFGISIPNRPEMEKWAFENIDKITGGKANAKMEFSFKDNALTSNATSETKLLDYKLMDKGILLGSNLDSIIPAEFHLTLKVKELKEVIWSGFSAYIGETKYRDLEDMKVLADKMSDKSELVDKIKSIQGGLELEKFFPEHDNLAELAEAIIGFAKEPGTLKVDLSVPESEWNETFLDNYLMSIMNALGGQLSSSDKENINNMYGYLSIKIEPK